jgi:hypothetical protein
MGIGAQDSRPGQAGPEMKRGEDRPPAFEVEVAACAQEMYFRTVGDVEWRTEGTANIERTGRRDGLPSPVLPHVRYKEVRVSTRIAASLAEPEIGQSPGLCEVEPRNRQGGDSSAVG